MKTIPLALLVTPAALLPSTALAQALEQTSSDGSTVTDWVQAIGSILAIAAGFSLAAWEAKKQRNAEKNEQAAVVRAAHTLAWDALATVGDRLENALEEEKARRRKLQGDRTTEMVRALREFDTTRLPGELLSDLLRLRSHVYAINERISNVYNSEEPDAAKNDESHEHHASKRRNRLTSVGRVWIDAVTLFDGFQSASESYGAVRKEIDAWPQIDSFVKEVRQHDERTCIAG